MSLFGKEKPQSPALLKTEISYTRSVVHSCAQASMRAMNECIGLTNSDENQAVADEYLATEDGKALMRGLKGYMLFALGKTI